MKKRMLCALLALLCLALGGCMSRQLEEQLLVIVLGVDEDENRAVHLSVKVPSNASGGSGGSEESSDNKASSGGGQMGYLLLEAKAETFADALALLDATTPRSLNFSQVREVVLGESAGTCDKFSSIIHNVYALPRMRSQAVVVFCKGKALEFVEAQKHYVGIRLSRYIETTLSSYAGKGFVPTTTLGEAFRDLGYGYQDPLLVCGAVNSFSYMQQPLSKNLEDAQAGTLSRKSVNPVELFGAAATDGVCVSGTLSGYEMALMHLIQGKAQSLSLQLEGDVPTHIYARRPAALSVDLDSRPIRLRVEMTCQGDYTPGFPPDRSALEERLRQDVLAALEHMQALRCDGLGFGNLAARSFLTIDDWDAFSWRDAYQAAQIDVSLSLQLQVR